VRWVPLVGQYGGYGRVPGWRLTTKCHGYIIGDKSNDRRDVALRVDMGNANQELHGHCQEVNTNEFH